MEVPGLNANWTRAPEKYHCFVEWQKIPRVRGCRNWLLHYTQRTSQWLACVTTSSSCHGEDSAWTQSTIYWYWSNQVERMPISRIAGWLAFLPHLPVLVCPLHWHLDRTPRKALIQGIQCQHQLAVAGHLSHQHSRQALNLICTHISSRRPLYKLKLATNRNFC